MKKILVTGATGFIGKALVRRLCADGFLVTAAMRRDAADFPPQVSKIKVGDLRMDADWSLALRGQSVILHCAGRAHVTNERALDPLEEFRAVNLHGTLKLALQAVDAGVRRFVFVSSIGVNGAETQGAPFTANDIVTPQSPYARSKYEAELGLKQIAEKTGLEVVIIRPPLVYGAEAPGNFGSLMRWLTRGLPLPLGAIHNRRSLVAVDNLVDLLVTCVVHPAASGETFLVSDGEDISTSELLRRMGVALGRSTHLIPVPMRYVEQAAILLGKRDLAVRLCGSLQIDIEKTCRVLTWHPPITLEQGLKKAAKGLRV